MNPVIALVGRPNVGKSTLFNCLTKTKKALVADFAGLTRDRQYGYASFDSYQFIVIDTGGMGELQEVEVLMHQQAQQAVNEADIVLFLIDAKHGVSGVDIKIAQNLRRQGKKIYVVANKTDGQDKDAVSAESYRLGLGEPILIAAAHNRGIYNLLERISLENQDLFLPATDGATNENELKIAIIGKPNVGKSTLVNALLGEQRVLTLDEPGTTRDSIYIPFTAKSGRQYTLIDTAGVRKRGKVSAKVEKFSVIKSLQAIADANVVVHVIDANEGATEQDLSLLRQVLNHGKALVFAINKWDSVSNEQKRTIKQQLSKRLEFVSYASFCYISALKQFGVDKVITAVDKAYANAMQSYSTKMLTELLQEATMVHQPPMVNNRRSKLRLAHQGGKNPPRIIIHGSMLDKLPQSYQRYLNNHFQKRLQIEGTPLLLSFKAKANPYQKK